MSMRCCQLQSLLCTDGLIVSAALLPACQPEVVVGVLHKTSLQK